MLTKSKLILERNYIASLNQKFFSLQKSSGNIVSIEAIVTGKPRSAPEGTWMIGGGIETRYKHFIYADKKLKSKIRIMLKNM